MENTQENYEFINSIARTINQQLGNNSVVWSWGTHKRKAVLYKDMAGLRFKVEGRLFKGWVYILYNEGKDLYEIEYLNNNLTPALESDKEVYFDMLLEIIDKKVETP